MQLPAFPYKRAKPMLGLPGKPRWEVSKRSPSADPPGSLGTPALRLLLKCVNYQELIDPGCLPRTPQSRERFGCQVPALLPSDASGHPATPIPSGYGAGHPVQAGLWAPRQARCLQSAGVPPASRPRALQLITSLPKIAAVAAAIGCFRSSREAGCKSHTLPMGCSWTPRG